MTKETKRKIGQVARLLDDVLAMAFYGGVFYAVYLTFYAFA
jgi:hypothetical protein